MYIRNWCDFLTIYSERNAREHPLFCTYYTDAPWCRHCKSLEPEFSQVAAWFEGTNIRLAKVDGTVETKLVERLEVCINRLLTPGYVL